MGSYATRTVPSLMPPRGVAPMCLRQRLSIGILVAIVAAPIAAQTPARVAAPIEWEAANADRARSEQERAAAFRTARAGLPDQQTLDATRLPVLVYAGEVARQAPRMRSQGTSYVALYLLPGAKLAIMGSATALPIAPESGLARQAETYEAPSSGQFEITEDGADLNLRKYGAAYVLRISCESARDQRCKTPNFLLSIASSLVVVGGRQQ